jgi:hypothetical protein
MGSKRSLNNMESNKNQSGVITVFMSMIMLLLITVMVIAAYSLSTTNLQVVGNMQAREEGIDAAMFIIDRTMQNPFYLAPTEELDQGVDINEDGQDDYFVDLAEPRCVRAVPAGGNSLASGYLPGLTSVGAYDTTWELDATATEPRTGASVRIVQGVRVLLSEADKDLLCTP